MNEELRIKQLREILHQHNINYYIHNTPTVSDQTFDLLMKELSDLEARHPELYDANSPSVRVGSDRPTNFSKWRMHAPCSLWAIPTPGATCRIFTTV